MIIFLLIFFILKIASIDGARTKQCSVLELPKHGFFFSGYCKRTPGSLCGLGCLTGYRLVNGDSFRECRQDGTWSGREPQCEAIRCPALKTHPRVIQECLPQQNTTKLHFGTKCEAKCNKTGYRLIGPRIRECLVMGRWTGYEQFCIVGIETTPFVITSSTSTHLLTTTPKYLDVTGLILFERLFTGRITRIEIWKQIISEQQLLVSYRDCRKQNGDIFSWSQVSNEILIDTNKLKSSSFCSGCSEPASIPGGLYRVSDYEVGSSVEYECNYGYEMIGASRAFCMVPSEWYPLPPIYNPCSSECELCEKKTGVCLRQQAKLNPLICDPPCDEDEVCIDGQCSWSNIDDEKHDYQCNPPCPFGTQCINRRCESSLTPYCPVICRPGQVCVDGRCGCFKGLCEYDRPCYEICDIGESCHNSSCSCGSQGKCGKGELCQLDICMCGRKRGGCRPYEHCINGICVCKTSSCDQCNNTCKSNEICLDGKCICTNQCQNAFCPFPCLNGGRCTGFYQCTCRRGWQGYRCERRDSILEK
ncbi:unnamed protein product [Rotaria sp. Silwood1]|nr:unnamed protein product [Rotaria sp. Silwood1]